MRTLEELKYEDVIDSRDIIDRIADLQAQDSEDDGSGLDADEREELILLEAFAEEASGYMPDWQYGETLIRDSYFREYAEQLADDIGAIDSNASWPLNFIDWDRAAAALQQDYTSIELDGVTYWGR